jgi:heme-degrading monooxygenase HmoA
MYGTVAKLHVKSGALTELNQLTKDFGRLGVPGFIASYVYQTDASSNECYLAVVFESKASYVANAESPEQDARYREMRALFEADPEWHDGEIVAAATAAG